MTTSTLKPLDTQSLQKDTLIIYEKLKHICVDLGLQHWIMYGTLIGAIRHKGFIPWDDDFDVAMPRSDYDQLLSYFRMHSVVDGLHIESVETNSNYPFYIARICDDEHKLVFSKYNYTSGLFIDIYPFDGMGNDLQYWIDQKKANFKLRRNICYSQYQLFPKGSGIAKNILRLPYVLYAKSKGSRYWFSLIDDRSRKYTWNESTYVGIPVWGMTVKEVKKEWFKKTIIVPFENTVVPIPEGYDDLLTSIYGNYMKFPPEEERKPSHGYKAYRVLR